MQPARTIDTPPERLSRPLEQSAVLAFALLVVLSFALMAGLLLHVASQQDDEAAKQSDAFVHAAIERRREVASKDVKDYAAWGEAYQHLHTKTDTEWAFDQQNVGTTVYTDLGYENVAVIGPTGSITYALVDGKLAAAAPAALVGAGLDALVRTARSAAPGECKPVVGLVAGSDTPLLVAAAVITPGGDSRIIPTDGPQSVLVFADRLTPARLDEIGRQSFVRGLRATALPQAAGPHLTLPATGGTGAVELRWEPERPGTALLWAVLPWLLEAAVAVALLFALIVRRMLHAAMLIETKSRALSEAHRQMEHAALHDALTQLPNRVLLHRFLADALRRPGIEIAVVFVDLDRFKPINDALGHRAGDHVLQTVAERLRQAVQPGDLVARVGGDEFVLVLADHLAGDRAERLCPELLRVVRLPIQVEGTTVEVGLSVGVATRPVDGASPADLLRHADMAMYAAKMGGGNGYRLFSSDMDEPAAGRLGLADPAQPYVRTVARRSRHAAA